MAGDDMLGFDEMPEIPTEQKDDDKVISPVKYHPTVDFPDSVDVWTGFSTDRPSTNTANIRDMGLDLTPVV